jgi:phosphocarrier protein HPr
MRTVTLRNKRGLHARASAKFVRMAEGFDAHVTVAKDGVEVPGTSIMGLMLLAAAQGEEVTITVTGRQAAQALEGLSALIIRGFDED